MSSCPPLTRTAAAQAGHMVDTLVMELAPSAEDDAIDALDFAEWAAQQAEVAVLDAIMPAPGRRTGGSLPHKLT
jgi:hypothetical protein